MQEGTPIIIKRKKAQGHAHHGGAWKVAYADFVTAMMAFFMVMWIVGLSEEDRNVIQSYFNDPIGFAKNQPRNPINIGPTGGPRPKQSGQASHESGHDRDTRDVEKVQREVEKVIEQDPALAEALKQGGLAIRSTSEGLAIEFIENEMNGELYFRLGSAEVRPKAKSMLAKIAPVLKASKRAIFLDGHTDSTPFPGPGYDNFDLSGARANQVRRILEAGGLPAKQILAVRAKADKEPRVVDNPRHFTNRRVTILLPYKFATEPVIGLPADVNQESIEGKFRVPRDVGPGTPNIRP